MFYTGLCVPPAADMRESLEPTPIICLLINLMNLYYITVCIGVNNKLLVLVLVLVLE